MDVPLSTEAQARIRDALRANLTPHEAAAVARDLVTYRPPRPEDVPKFGAVREACGSAIATILSECPPCADRTAAIRSVREGMMAATAAIVLQGIV